MSVALASCGRGRPWSVSARQSGFTLMEVLIAVSITAVIGLGIWQVLSSVVTARDRVDEVSAEFENLQKTFLLLERDLRQVTSRPVRNIYGDYEPALTSAGEAFLLQVTRQGWRNPLGKQRSELQRSAWEFTGDEVRRRYWVMLDQAQEEESHDQLMLDGVTAFSMRFLDEERTWQEDWPPPNQGIPSGPGAPVIRLPLAVEVTLEHERYGELTRLFLMPDFNVTAVQTSISQGNQGEDEAEEGEDDDTGETGETSSQASDQDQAPQTQGDGT
ncbi:general secretion pathway protein J [Marinobacter segnicrescens]|uniref:Type II secretion system protein J n=1 Tax=Marinobacter segnicrescens TaxID=430453 RepID=A0A1I0GFA8_9GAMM|nr:type II secretion system minor pseudopilin GspJ [Marinobacter segnicrescens]SET68687.1 general secretion pathway protein J [Marinobacter segnicrescens]